MKSYLSALLIFFLLLTTSAPAAMAEVNSPQEHGQLVSLVSDALISAGDKNWTHTSETIAKMKTLWTAKTDASPEAKAVSEAFAKAETALAASNNGDEAKLAVSGLAKAVDAYVTSHQEDAKSGNAQEKVKNLLPFVQKSLTAVKASDWTAAKQSFSRYVSGWKQAESAIRKENFAAYGKIEAKISAARIALNTEPPSAETATAKLQDLSSALEEYVSGKAQAGTTAGEQKSMADLLELLMAAQTDLSDKKISEAAAKMDTFINEWPAVEGEVMTRSPEAYDRIENKMTSITSALLSSPPDVEKAGTLLAGLQEELLPYMQAASYTAWDAGLILFREGLETILVIAALVAFLGRTGNGDKRKWIWSGAGAGIVASGGLAFVLTAFLSKAAAGSSRELIEGIMGLIAVVFMVTVGAWLHSKSNIRAWNQFIEKTLGTVVAKGALWSLAATAFLAVMREGAETIIFYVGMAPSIETSQLLIGIVGALLILFVIGFAMLRLSNRIPVRPFFLAASLLLYYLAFKFIGVSVHALQIANQLPSHVPGYLLNVPSLGIYPSWETTIPQLVVLVLVVWSVVRNERKQAAIKNASLAS